MEDLIYQDIPEHLRESELKAQATVVEEGKYKKFFNDIERAEKNKEYVKDSADLFRTASAYKLEIARMNADLKAKRAELNEKLQIVDNGFINVEGKLYMFDDQEAGDMFIYDGSGTLVEKRRLRPEEREYLSFRKIVND